MAASLTCPFHALNLRLRYWLQARSHSHDEAPSVSKDGRHRSGVLMEHQVHILFVFAGIRRDVQHRDYDIIFRHGRHRVLKVPLVNETSLDYFIHTERRGRDM